MAKTLSSPLLWRVTVSQDQSDTTCIGLAGLVYQEAMDGIFIKLVMLSLAGTVRLKPKLLTINLMSYAVDLVEQVLLDGGNHVKVGLKKVREARIGHVGMG